MNTIGAPVHVRFVTMTYAENGHRKRKAETSYINAKKLGNLKDRTHRLFEDEEIARITDAYHRWRGKGAYKGVPGFSKTATREEFAVKFSRLRETLYQQFEESTKLQAHISQNLRAIQGVQR